MSSFRGMLALITLAGILATGMTPQAWAAKKPNPRFASLLLVKQSQPEDRLTAREVQQGTRAVNSLLQREAHLTANAHGRVPAALLLGRNLALRRSVIREIAVLDRQIQQLTAFLNSVRNPFLRLRLLRRLQLLNALQQRLEIAFGLTPPPPLIETTPTNAPVVINPFGF